MIDTKKKIQEMLDKQTDDVRRIIGEVFNIERSRLYQRHPRGLGPEIGRAIKEIVK